MGTKIHSQFGLEELAGTPREVYTGGTRRGKFRVRVRWFAVGVRVRNSMP